MPERRVNAVHPVQVADPAYRVPGEPGDLDSQRGQARHGPRHQSLAAGLVDGERARLGDDNRQPRLNAPDRGCQARGAAGHQDVDHGVAGVAGVTLVPGAAAARARTSQRIRTVSRTALSTVKQIEVIHAVPTSGSAAPSTMTAT